MSLVFKSHHSDLVHGLAYDYYGKRFASCSSDMKIKIWDQVESPAKEGSAKWRCTSEWKAASGAVWNVTWAHPEFGQVLASCSFDRGVVIWEEQPSPQGTGTVWVKRATLPGAKDSVKSISFAPRHFGLKLAAGSLDGVVRIYDAMDVMNLSHWVETASFEVSPAGSEVSLSWNTSRSEAQTLVTGGPNGVRIFGFNGREWAVVGVCDTHDTLEVSWAANVGRSSHLIAASTRENGVRLHSVKLPTQDRAFQSSVVAEFSEHRCLVRRLSWNITGTLLCSSGDDGAVRYWKCNHIGQWKCVGVHSPANSRESEVGDVVIPAARVV